jgi:autotransporter passenger strand-loop-strand repeat protein
MQINVTYDTSVSAAPAGFKAAINYVVGLLDAAFTNKVTINLKIGWGEVDGSALDADDLGENFEAAAPAYTYSTVTNALIAGAISPAQQMADATLPASDPTNGGVFDIGSADAKALGLIAANAPATDGWVGFSSAVNWSFSPTAAPTGGAYDFIGSAMHEITEVMGRDSLLGTGYHYAHGFSIMDMFRYSAPGVRELAPGLVHSTGYFSIDNGVTNLGNWNNHVATGDLGDWGSGFGAGGGPGPNGNDSFNNESDPNVLNRLSESDLTLMNVIGWDTAAPANEIINGEIYFVAAGQTVNDLVVLTGGTLDVRGISNAATLDGGSAEIFQGGVANGIVINAGTELTVDPGGTENGAIIAGGYLDLESGASAGTSPIVFQGTGGTLEIDGSAPPNNVISGFAAGDAINFFGAAIGAHPSVTLLAGNVLEIVEHGKTYDFQLDPNDNFAGQTFHVSGDGQGGTLIYIDPGVLSVSASGADIVASTGDLDAGRAVTLSLNTNEAINVNTSGGTPTLSLNDGGTATYAGGSGTSALAFTYTVATGENTSNLAITAVNLNGGTAQDANGHDAVFSDAIGTTIGTLQIDTTPPSLTGITASPAGGIEIAGSAVMLTLAFNEAVKVSGGTPTLSLNDGGSAVYDAAATAALHDATKLAFDYLVSGNDAPTPALAVTGLNPQGATVTDLGGNSPDFSAVAATFSGLSVNDAPAYTIAGFTRPELHLDSAGAIILDTPAAAAAAAYGLKFLYAGLPDSIPYPPVPDTSHAADFHLLT